MTYVGSIFNLIPVQKFAKFHIVMQMRRIYLLMECKIIHATISGCQHVAVRQTSKPNNINIALLKVVGTIFNSILVHTTYYFSEYNYLDKPSRNTDIEIIIRQLLRGFD